MQEVCTSKSSITLPEKNCDSSSSCDRFLYYHFTAVASVRIRIYDKVNLSTAGIEFFFYTENMTNVNNMIIRKVNIKSGEYNIFLLLPQIRCRHDDVTPTRVASYR